MDEQNQLKAKVEKISILNSEFKSSQLCPEKCGGKLLSAPLPSIISNDEYDITFKVIDLINYLVLHDHHLTKQFVNCNTLKCNTTRNVRIFEKLIFYLLTLYFAKCNNPTSRGLVN